MYNLKEFNVRRDKLTNLLPWAALIAPGVIQNKDGSFQQSFAFRGPDLDSATRNELIVTSAKINNVLKRLTGGWAFYSEAQRIFSQRYPESAFPNPISLMIDAERRDFFDAGNHFESLYFLTLVYLPPPDKHDKLEKVFIERNVEKERETGEIHLKTFMVETERVLQLFAEIMPEAEPLSDDETLTYLHSCVSPKRHCVKTPDVPMYLDAFIADTPLVPGLEPKFQIGPDKFCYIRTVSVLGYPGSSTPGILDNLNRLNFEYRWVTRFLPLDKTDALAEVERYKKRWYAKRKGLAALIKETFMNEESPASIDTDAENKSTDANAALQEIAEDLVSGGFLTQTITVWDTDQLQVEKKVRAVEKTINGLGFTTIDETVNAVEAWLGSLPGLCRANVRRPLLNSMNLSHLFTLSAVWAGPERNKKLDAPALMRTQTAGNTPFRLDLHVGDVGHTMIVGPTGSGKSVLLAHIAAQFQRYENAQVYVFDKDASIRALTAGVGGDFYDLANEEDDALSFQPLANIDDENERAWAAGWVYDFLTGENVVITPEIKSTVWTGLCSLATSPRDQRTITGLTYILQDAKIRQALEPATIKGAYGRLHDAKADNLAYGRWQVFEMGQLMNTPAAVPPTLSYLFHKLEQRFDGSPSVILLDECWLMLDNPIFAAKIREWLKVLRKKNVSVVFATQNLQDVKDSVIASSIKESCPTKIFLPNPHAKDDDTAPVYKSFGLNDREIQQIAMATPKKQYYYRSVLGSRLFELAPGPVGLAYCAASSSEDQEAIKRILAEHGREGFNEAWLAYKNLPDALQLYKKLTTQSLKEVA